jgi:hypothetical protein
LKQFKQYVVTEKRPAAVPNEAPKWGPLTKDYPIWDHPGQENHFVIACNHTMIFCRGDSNANALFLISGKWQKLKTFRVVGGANCTDQRQLVPIIVDDLRKSFWHKGKLLKVFAIMIDALVSSLLWMNKAPCYWIRSVFGDLNDGRRVRNCEWTHMSFVFSFLTIRIMVVISITFLLQLKAARRHFFSQTHLHLDRKVALLLLSAGDDLLLCHYLKVLQLKNSPDDFSFVQDKWFLLFSFCLCVK